MKKVLLAALIFALAGSECTKNNSPSDPDVLGGTWIRKGTDGNGPGNKLQFSAPADNPMLYFDCGGSPASGQQYAYVPYRFSNNQLSYLNYADSAAGFYPVTSFRWVETGREFSVEFHQILLYMSAVYEVSYVKQ